MIMSLNGMAYLGDLRVRFPRDGNACHRLRDVHLVRHRPSIAAHLRLGGNDVARDARRSCHS